MAKNYKRILIKLSGEALADHNENLILGANNLNKVGETIKTISANGTQVCIVVGAGNIWRGRLAESIGIDQSDADYMGMLGTIINASALKASLKNNGVNAKVLSAIEVKQIGELYTKEKAENYLNEGNVVIFGGGTGNPYFTTDTAAALRAKELHCDAILMAKNGVDGVFDSDPRKNKDAKMIAYLTYQEMLERNLAVMDNTAVSLCMDTDIEIRVFNMADYDNFIRVVNGQDIGTTINKGE